jgi:tetratricopeptide (TPR) repeat protein
MFLWMLAPAMAMTIESDQQLTFADTLFNNHQFSRAAEEYQRFVFFFPNHHRKRAAVFKAGESLFLAQDPGNAIELFRSLTQVQPLDELAIESFFKMSECFLSLNSPSHAVAQLNNVIALSDDPNIKDRAIYRIGWIHIDLADWAGAQKAFAKLSSTGIHHYARRSYMKHYPKVLPSLLKIRTWQAPCLLYPGPANSIVSDMKMP